MDRRTTDWLQIPSIKNLAKPSRNGGFTSDARSPPLPANRPTVESTGSQSYPEYSPSSPSNALRWGQRILHPTNKNTLVVDALSPRYSPRYSYATPVSSRTDGYLSDSRDYYGSILKKKPHSDGYVTDGSLQRSQRGKRKVAFKNSVSVYRYDSDAERSSSLTESDRLVAEPGYRRLSLERPGTMHPKTVDNQGYSSDESNDGWNRIHAGNSTTFQYGGTLSSPSLRQMAPSSIFQPSMTSSSSSSSSYSRPRSDSYVIDATPRSSSVSISGSSPKFSQIEDQTTTQKKLTIALQLSADLLPHEVLVKANKNGNKIIIVINRDTDINYNRATNNNSNNRHCSESISLPFQVDPYRLNARLDRDGILHIEAPVVQS